LGALGGRERTLAVQTREDRAAIVVAHLPSLEEELIMFRRRSVAVLAVPAVVALAVAGCGGGSANQTSSTTPNMAGGLQQQFVRVVGSVSPKVVEVQTSVGLGSGVVFDRLGDVVTNAHVVGSAHSFTVRLAGGTTHSATLVGSDPKHDLAVIRLVGAQPAPATFANAGQVQIGDLVLAIGNPLGLRSSVTQGIVSSLGRTVSEGNGVSLSPTVQTSAAINPGNSGGALVDLAGQVVGIPTLTALDPEFANTPAPGIGFAIPSGTVKQVATSLIAAAQTAPTAAR
jgi:putative serine protease PepD